MVTQEEIKSYKEKGDRLFDEREKLRKRIYKFKKEYISAMLDGVDGKKVRCYRKYTIGTTEHYEYVGDGYVSCGSVSDYNFDFTYAINKVKKDGTMSMQSAGYWGVSKIELIED